MKPADYQRLRDVFLAARERKGAARQTWLLGICGDDEEMLAEVHRLLASEQDASQFLERTDESSDSREAAPTVGERIGPYSLREPLGEGGFAEVFLAEQAEPVRRRVALKLLKPGMDSREILARFEAEGQALAMMQHSGIAKIFDAGISEAGRSWFAMEYVDGVPITEYCDTHRLGLRARLEIFIEVCEAIQHAHQKGVIHRDLKPSNILVGMAEGRPQAKVIDFGIAKATGRSLTDKTVFTARGMLIGTPAYMSPEQAEMSGVDIDTRSDVYSLGVLLYELLSGEPPFHPQRLMEAGFGEIQRIIREETPPKPSTKSTTIENAQKIAELRCLDLNNLRKRLHGDLDWIAIKALEKDRTRRYATVQELAVDLGRHLADEPVEAGPPSAGYRFAKFVRRNRVGVAAGALVLLALAAGIATTTWQWQQARSAERQARNAQKTAVIESKRAQTAERDAVTQRDKAKAAQAEATDARDQAKKRSEELAKVNTELTAEREKLSIEKTRLEKVVEFQEGTLTGLDTNKMGRTLMRLFREGIAEQLTQTRRTPEEVKEAVERFSQLAVRANPTDVAKDLLNEEILTAAVATIDEGFTEDPITEASLRTAVARVYWTLGLFGEELPLCERALELRRKHLGDDHPDTLRASLYLGTLLSGLDRLDEAEACLREVVETCSRVFADDGSHMMRLTSLGDLAELLDKQGKFDEAEALHREVLKRARVKLRDDHPLTLAAASNVGGILYRQGKAGEAEPYYREALERSRRVLGNGHPNTLVPINNLGRLLMAQNKFDEATPLLREALAGKRRILGNDHPSTLTSIRNLADLLQTQSRLDEATPLLREAVEGYRHTLGGEHSNTLIVINNLGILLYRQDKFGKAEPHLREALEGFRRVFGDRHPHTLAVINTMGLLLRKQGRLGEAEPHSREALEGRRRVFGRGHPHTLSSINGLGILLCKKGKFVEVEKLARELIGKRPATDRWHIKGKKLLDTIAAAQKKKAAEDAASKAAKEAKKKAADGLKRVLPISVFDNKKKADAKQNR